MSSGCNSAVEPFTFSTMAVSPSPRGPFSQRYVEDTPRDDGLTYRSVDRLGGSSVQHTGFKLPLRALLVAVLCVFAIGPAVGLWMGSWQTGQDALGGVQDLAMSSVKEVSTQLKDSLMQSVEASLQVFVDRGETAVGLMKTHINASGVLHGSGKAASQSSAAVEVFQEQVFSIVAMSPWMHRMNLSLYADVQDGSAVTQAEIVGWSNIDLETQQLVPTLFSTPLRVNAFDNATATSFCLANTTTGEPVSCFRSVDSPYRTPFPGVPSGCEWGNTITFLEFFGIPDTSLVCGIPFADGLAYFAVQIDVNMYTISGMLLSLVPSSQDRLFLIFRTAAGTMVGASHGKFFSHSDFDFNANNPFANPPPIS
eukprot:RCo003404